MTQRIPTMAFVCRQGDETPEAGGCPIGGEFVLRTSTQLFDNQRVIVFSLPGAFTPTCSTYQLPGFEKQFAAFQSRGIDAIYCVSVNDAFVMNEWARALEITHIQVLPDGNGDFTRGMGMLIDMTQIGFGHRSRRYAMVVNNGTVERMFVEPEADSTYPDPYGQSSPETVMAYLNTV